MQPTFSVIIPLYNKGPYIRRAVDSVLAQTDQAFEIVVIDDGSTDEGPAFVAGYADPRIRLITQNNAGVSAARNRGIAEARADWLAFLDADDEYLPHFLQEVRAVIERYPEAGMVFTNWLWIRGMGEEPVLAFRESSLASILLDDYFRFACAHNRRAACSSAIAVSKQAILAAGAFPAGVAYQEDNATWVRIAFRYPVGMCPRPLAIYHNEVEGVANRVNAGQPVYPYTVTALRAQSGEIPPRLRSSTQRYIEEYLRQYVRLTCRFGNPGDGRQVLLHECAIGIRPGQYGYLLLLTLFPPRLSSLLVTFAVAMLHGIERYLARRKIAGTPF
ncbi:MAG: glycosyltransferase [Armatimonadota bacterium]